jgi:hypothetical protein
MRRLLLPKLVIPIAVALFALTSFARHAHADRVDRLISQLESDDDYKVRLAAASSLAKTRDRRAVPALTRSLLDDDDKNVRGLAATALGKLIDSKTPQEPLENARKALEKAAKKDKASVVRKQAKRALEQLAALASDEGGAGIYVNVGTMSDKASGDGKMRLLMRKTVEKTIKKKATEMTTAWPGGKEPSAKQLAAKKAKGFHVDGTLVSLTTESKGSTTLVSCKISMLIATYPKKSMFGFLDGGAKVQAGSSATDVQYAQEDCVAAVVEDLVARKIIPTIQSK